MARRPDLVGGDRRRSPPAAELDLVPAGEVVQVAADVVLRTVGLEQIVRVVGHPAVVDVVVLAEAANRRQHEGAADVRDLHRGEELRPDVEVAFAFVVAGRPSLVPRGFGRTRRADAPAVLALVVVVVGEVAADAFRHPPVHFEGPGLEVGLVEVAGEGEQVDGGPRHRAPDEQPVLEDRPAEVEAVVVVLVRAVPFSGGISERLRQLRRDVHRLQALVLEVVARVEMRGVRPLAQHHVQLHAAGGILRVGAARRDRHFLEAVEVVVERRRAGRAHVGDRHAVEAPGVVGRLRALGVVVRLLARFGAADVDAVHVHRGHGLHDHPGIARARDVLELLHRDVGRRRIPPHVDDRRGRGDDDGFGGARDAEPGGDGCGRAAQHDHGVVGVAVETGECGVDRIGADRKVQEMRLALHVGDLGLVHRAGKLHGHARHPAAGGVLDGDVHAAREHLRRDPRHETARHDECRERNGASTELTIHPIAPSPAHPSCSTPPSRRRRFGEPRRSSRERRASGGGKA